MSTGSGKIGSGTDFTKGTEETTGTKKTSGTQDLALTFDPTAKTALDTSLTSTEYNKSQAIADAKAASEATMKTLLEKQAPGLATAVKSTGGYDSTTNQQLQNDLLARTSAAGSQVILDAISKYGSIRTGDINAATGAVSATTGKKISTTGLESASTTMSKQGRADKIATEAGVGGEKGSVICTQLYNDGHIPEEVYRADQLYVDKHFSQATINGYRFWAVPFVYAMRANKYVYAVGKYIGIRWCYHCASHYTVNTTIRRNLFTTVAMWFGVPICFCIGSIIPEVKYYKLWAGS